VFFDFLHNFCRKHCYVLRRIQQDIIIYMYIGLHVKYPLFLSNVNETCILLKHVQKIIKYQVSLQSVQWQPSSSMQTDLTKLIVISRNFVNAPDKLLEIFVILHVLYSTPDYIMHAHFRGNMLVNKPARCEDNQNCAITLFLSLTLDVLGI
jgi:hypothetical protein